MYPKRFLLLNGILFVVLSLLGLAVPNMFGGIFSIERIETATYVAIAVGSLALSALPFTGIQKTVTFSFAFAAFFFGISGFIVSNEPAPNFYHVVNIEQVESGLYLVLGMWALVAAYGHPPRAEKKS